jgi:hypothetical protein
MDDMSEKGKKAPVRADVSAEDGRVDLGELEQLEEQEQLVPEQLKEQEQSEEQE